MKLMNSIKNFLDFKKSKYYNLMLKIFFTILIFSNELAAAADRASQFTKGVSSSKSLPTIIGIIGAIVLIIIIYIIIVKVTKTKKERKKEREIISPEKISDKIVTSVKDLNFHQKKCIIEIIKEFKIKNVHANIISTSVFERYSEFIFSKLDEILSNKEKTSEYDDYPLKPGNKIEIEIEHKGTSFIFESTVIESVVDKGEILIRKFPGGDIDLVQGLEMTIHYDWEHKYYYSGESYILIPNYSGSILISYPENIKLNERKTIRIPLPNLKGQINSFTLKQPIYVILRNLSFEGVRIGCKALLNKNDTFKLSFADSSFKTKFEFRDLACMICKTYFIKEGYYEYGLNFVYIDVYTKKKIFAYLKNIVINLKRAKK